MDSDKVACGERNVGSNNSKNRAGDIHDGQPMDTSQPNISKTKTVRKRKRKLMQQILCQMEFYFSEANLRRDKFLNTLLTGNEQGYIELSIFLTFNKIRALTDDVRIIAKSLLNSQLLQVSDDHKRVRRLCPVSIVSDEEINRRTIYVEGVKASSSHDGVSRQFSAFGPVSYVSLPKYPNSDNCKGFAFIEYEQESAAKQALEYFNGNAVECSSESKNLAECPDGGVSASNVASGAEEAKARSADISSAHERRGVKRAADGANLHAEQNTDVTKRVKHDDKTSATTSNTTPVEETEKEHTSPATDTKRKKKKQRKRQKKKKQKEAGSTSDAKTSEILSTSHSHAAAVFKDLKLKVISKDDWSALRKEYLKLQRKSMASLKKSLSIERTRHQEEHQEQRFIQHQKPVAPIQGQKYPPGTIVKLRFPDGKPICDQIVKDIKSHVSRASCNASYYDLKSGDATGYIRCTTAGDATALLKHPPPPELSHVPVSLLTGKEEDEYWSLIKEKKWSAKKGGGHQNSSSGIQHDRNTTRGRDKLIHKAEHTNQTRQTHTYFTNSDDED